MRFIGCDTLVTKFGGLDPQNYHMVCDGKIEANELERIYGKFDGGQEVLGHMGHSLPMLGMIELYDEETSESYYVDYRDLKPVVLGESEPVQPQALQLWQWESDSEWLPLIT